MGNLFLRAEEVQQILGVSKSYAYKVIKEMNYLMREQDEADEERFRKLDAAIRGNLKKKEPKKRWGRNKKEKA